jgi:outer membrane protein assembly factor BamB
MIRVVAGPGRSGPLRVVADGVRLNPGLPDEPMPATLLALATALGALARGKGAQVIPLRRAGLLWVLHQEGHEVVLRWVRRVLPSGVVRAARLELKGLLEATGAALEPLPKTVRLQRALRPRTLPSRHPEQSKGFVLEQRAGPLTLRLEVDPVPQDGGSPWLSLLAGGRLAILDPTRSLGGSDAPPFLAVDALTRFAERAVKLGRRAPLPLSTGGTLSLDGDTVQLGRHRFPEQREPLARAIAELGLALVLALQRTRPRLTSVEAVKELRERASAILQRTRQQPLPARRGAQPPARMPPPARGKPLTDGILRQVRLEPLFEHRLPGSIERMRLQGEVLLVEGDGELTAVELDGTIRWSHRLQAASLGQVLLGVAVDGRLWRLDVATGQPHWFRDGEGATPRALHALGDGLLLLEEADALSGRCSETGLAVWRFRLPAGDTLGVSVGPDRIFVCSSGGHIAALDPKTGEPHFRAMAQKPFRRAPLLAGDGLFALLEDDDGDALLHVDAATAEVRWMGKLGLRQSSALHGVGQAVVAVGQGGDGWALASIDTGAGKGELVPLPVEGRQPPAVVPTRAGLVVAGADGRALLWTGRELRVLASEATRPTLKAVVPVCARELVLLASETPALHDLATGRRVATLPAMEGLVATAADEALRVIVADDQGLIRGYRLAGHLSVPPAPPPL